MNVEILQENLQKTLSVAFRFAGKKATLPILNNILIKTGENSISIEASNIENQIRISTPAKVLAEGSAVIPIKTLSEYVKFLPAGKIQLSLKDFNLLVVSGDSKATINGLNPADFPELKEEVFEQKQELSVDSIRDIVQQVSFSSSKEEARPVLSSVLIKIGGGKIEVVSTDGYRLSRLFLANPLKNKSSYTFLIRAKVVQELYTLLSDAGEKSLFMSVSDDERSIQFSFGKTTIISRIIEGEYPKYQKIIPLTHEHSLDIDRQEFLEALKTASIFARQSAYLVKCNFEGAQLSLSATASSVGSQTSNLDVKANKEITMQIAFNVMYLLEFLSHVDSKTITLGINGPLQPVTFSVPENEDFTHVIMPVRTQS